MKNEIVEILLFILACAFVGLAIGIPLLLTILEALE